MLVILRNKWGLSNEELFNDILDLEDNNKYFMMKTYFLNEFAIAIVEKD
jgi:hypothetical protein